MALPALNIVALPRAELEQRRQYDTAALRAALQEHPLSLENRTTVRNVHRAEDEQRREYDTSALRAALEEHPVVLETPTSDRTHNRPTRHSRRPTSYFNAFQTSCSTSSDAPPNYAIATKRRGTGSSDFIGTEKLPDYSCSVSADAKLYLNVESTSPLSGSATSDWKEVYVTVRGTMLNVYRLKDGTAGRLIHTYTMQHAEVGLAPDVEHTVLVPQTRFAQFIPSSARRRAWQKDQDMFRPVQQTILRLRAETDQLLLSGPEEEGIHAFMFAIGSAIDIAQPIDDRSIPRQCTVPRRRRRVRTQPDSDLTDPALLAEQERIFQSMYPSLAAERRSERPPTPVREEDEVDVSLLREEAPEDNTTVRPPTVRQTTSTSITSTFSTDMLYATSPTNFDLNGKWSPSHIRSPAQVQRYLRRCLPLLLADSPRASDIIICSGRRAKINWRMELLEDWSLLPPTYKSHQFPPKTGSALMRTQSQSSATESTSQQTPGSLFSNEQQDHDEITPVESGLENLQLTKVFSTTTDKRASNPISLPVVNNGGEVKGQETQDIVREIPTVGFYF